MKKLEDLSWEERAIAAEKTVEVLADKVTGLLNGSQNVFQRQLERARQREEKNAHRRAIIETRSAALEKYSEQLEIQVQERTAELRAILDNVAFGFFLVDRDFRVLKGYTDSCYRLIGTRQIQGRQVDELLGLCERKASSYIAGLMQLLENLLPEEVLVDQVLQRFEIDDRVLRIEPRLIRDEEGYPDKILMSVNDISSLEAAQRESRKNTLLVEVLRCKEAFVRFLQDTRNSLERAIEHNHNQPVVRRILHTIKGNSATYDLECIVDLIHATEEHERISVVDLREVSLAFISFLRENESVLELDFNDLESVKFEVSQTRFKELRGLSALSDDQALKAWTAQVALKPAHSIIGPIESFVYKLAQRLDKLVEFETRGLSTRIDETLMGPVLRSLTHLLRNAIDHGLEPSHERGSKNQVGKISLTLSEDENAWQLVVLDDGRGIDVNALCTRAVALGKATQAQVSQLSPEAKLNLVFMDGVSSRLEVNEISGRGVGTSAVLTEARRAGGTVDVDSKPGQGTRFCVRIPKPEILTQKLSPAA